MVAAKKNSKTKTVAKSAQPVIEVPVSAPASDVLATKVASVIPEGMPKSGRAWKTKQQTRFSVINRSGMMSHLNKSYEEKEKQRVAHKNMKMLENEMKEEKKAKLNEAKEKRDEQQKRRMANEYKNSVYQVIKPETMKGMSKKQLRMVRKTAVNRKNGQTELVPVFQKGGGRK